MKPDQLGVFFVVWLIPFLCSGQPLTPLIEINQITDAELDGSGNIYVLTQSGTIHKLTLEGVHQQSMSFDNVFSATGLDVTQAFRIFVFISAGQRFLMLDRNLRLLNDHRLDDTHPGNIPFATCMPDHQFWLYDETRFSLVKYNPLTRQRVFEVDLTRIIREQPLQITNMENHQNRLYLHVRGEILYVFDLNGNLIKSHPLQGEGRISFYKDRLFLVSGNRIISLDLYTGEHFSLPFQIREPEQLIKVLPSEDRIYLVYDKRIMEAHRP